MTFEDSQILSQWKAAEAAGLAKIDRFDADPASLPRFDAMLDVIDFAMNAGDDIQGEPR